MKKIRVEFIKGKQNSLWMLSSKALFRKNEDYILLLWESIKKIIRENKQGGNFEEKVLSRKRLWSQRNNESIEFFRSLNAFWDMIESKLYVFGKI